MVDAAVCEIFGCNPHDSALDVARKVLYKGRDEFWIDEDDFAAGAIPFLVTLAAEIAIAIHPEDRNINVPKRIESIVRNAANYCPRLMAPGILLAVNPKARLPKAETASIVHLHKLARLQILAELAPFVSTIFRELVDYGHIKDSSRTFISSAN